MIATQTHRTAETWNIDTVTDLIRHADGTFSIMWAGAEFGPEATLEDLCTGDLLASAYAALTSAGKPVNVHRCDVGPLGDSMTVVL